MHCVLLVSVVINALSSSKTTQLSNFLPEKGITFIVSFFAKQLIHISSLLPPVVCQNLSSAFVVCQNLSSAFTCTSLHKNPPTTSHITTQIMLYFALISMLYSSSSRLLTDSSHLHTVSLLNLVEEERLPCAPASYACS